MYSLEDYGNMIADRWRFDAYAKAIASAIRPGDAVVEIGCGPGVFCLLACRAGARRVYAIESEDSIQFARALADANGLADRIEFIQTDSRKVALPETVDVIVSDIRGTLPLSGSAIPSIEDARRRFLAPHGTLIPIKDRLRVALVEAKEYYDGLTSPWKSCTDGLDLSSSLALILNETFSVSFKPSQLLSEPQIWHVLNYAEGATASAGASMTFCAERTGTAHGLCIWFETQLFGDIGYSSGPGGTSTIYGQIFLPFLEPVEVAQGQAIGVDLRADLVGRDYIWRWETKIDVPGTAVRHFRQSTFEGANFARLALRRRSGDFAPKLSETGEAEKWLLQAMDGSSSLREIAQEANRRFPRLFSSCEEAFRYAAELSGKFSR